MINNVQISLENALNLDYRILAVIGILLFLSLLFIALGLSRFSRGKFIIASIQSLSGLSLLLAGLLFLSIAMNLYSYERLTYEQSIAELSIKQIDEQQFQLEILYEDEKKPDSFLINGDEWQIDARIIKWHGWAQLLGLNSQYRLERISGRYFDINEERLNPRSVYSLGPKDNIDYWKIINDYKKWFPWVDAYYGSAAYLPMTDNATYKLSLTQTGLIARPKNNKTVETIELW